MNWFWNLFKSRDEVEFEQRRANLTELTDADREFFINKIEDIEAEALRAAKFGHAVKLRRLTRKMERLIAQMNQLPGLEGVVEHKNRIYNEFIQGENRL